MRGPSSVRTGALVFSLAMVASLKMLIQSIYLYNKSCKKRKSKCRTLKTPFATPYIYNTQYIYVFVNNLLF